MGLKVVTALVVKGRSPKGLKVDLKVVTALVLRKVNSRVVVDADLNQISLFIRLFYIF